MSERFQNPFRPGAGHQPPYLAGREVEEEEFLNLLEQDIILENMILTGLRGTGKTVLLDSFRPLAVNDRWKWVGTDLSESATVSEDNMVKRLLVDLSVVTSDVIVRSKADSGHIGFMDSEELVDANLGYDTLRRIYESTPGLALDKLKSVLEFAWECLEKSGACGLVFAYDEAQNLSDQAHKEEYPLSILLDVFQSLQKKGYKLLLVLTGLPTLLPTLVKARTYSERMFRIVELGRLSETASEEAIRKPIEDTNCPVELNDESVETIVKLSAGYPYFIQFICREVYDVFLQGGESVPVKEIVKKLDSYFFAARWAKATDRQRELLALAASLDNSDEEFTVRYIVNSRSREEKDIKPFSASHVNQMLSTLATAGLVYKNRRGKYAFAVPLMKQFILRQLRDEPK